MLRQAVFGVLLTFAIGAPPGAAFAPQETPASAAPRPPAEIPLARLKADAIVPAALEAGAVATADGIWVPGRSRGTLVRIDAKANTAGPAVAVGQAPCASLELAFGSLWVPLCGDGTIARVDPHASTVTATARVTIASGDGRIASGVGSVWVVTDRKGVVSRIDADTNAPVAEVYVASGATAVVAGKDALWITSATHPEAAGPRPGASQVAAGRLTRVSPHNHEVVAEIAVGPRPGRLAVGEGGVWVLNLGDGSVTRVDPETNKAVATIPVGSEATTGEIAAGAGSVWVSLPGVPLIRIDPRTNRAVQRFTGDGGGAVLVAHGSLWVAAGPDATWRLDPRLVEAVRP